MQIEIAHVQAPEAQVSHTWWRQCPLPPQSKALEKDVGTWFAKGEAGDNYIDLAPPLYLGTMATMERQ